MVPEEGGERLSEQTTVAKVRHSANQEGSSLTIMCASDSVNKQMRALTTMPFASNGYQQEVINENESLLFSNDKTKTPMFQEADVAVEDFTEADVSEDDSDEILVTEEGRIKTQNMP